MILVSKIRNACSPFFRLLIKKHRHIEKSSAPDRETDRGGGFEKRKEKRYASEAYFRACPLPLE